MGGRAGAGHIPVSRRRAATRLHRQIRRPYPGDLHSRRLRALLRGLGSTWTEAWSGLRQAREQLWSDATLRSHDSRQAGRSFTPRGIREPLRLAQMGIVQAGVMSHVTPWPDALVGRRLHRVASHRLPTRSDPNDRLHIPISPPESPSSRLNHRNEGAALDANHPANGLLLPRRSQPFLRGQQETAAVEEPRQVFGLPTSNTQGSDVGDVRIGDDALTLPLSAKSPDRGSNHR